MPLPSCRSAFLSTDPELLPNIWYSYELCNICVLKSKHHLRVVCLVSCFSFKITIFDNKTSSQIQLLHVLSGSHKPRVSCTYCQPHICRWWKHWSSHSDLSGVFSPFPDLPLWDTQAKTISWFYYTQIWGKKRGHLTAQIWEASRLKPGLHQIWFLSNIPRGWETSNWLKPFSPASWVLQPGRPRVQLPWLIPRTHPKGPPQRRPWEEWFRWCMWHWKLLMYAYVYAYAYVYVYVCVYVYVYMSVYVYTFVNVYMCIIVTHIYIYICTYIYIYIHINIYIYTYYITTERERGAVYKSLHNITRFTRSTEYIATGQTILVYRTYEAWQSKSPGCGLFNTCRCADDDRQPIFQSWLFHMDGGICMFNLTKFGQLIPQLLLIIYPYLSEVPIFSSTHDPKFASLWKIGCPKIPCVTIIFPFKLQFWGTHTFGQDYVIILSLIYRCNMLQQLYFRCNIPLQYIPTIHNHLVSLVSFLYPLPSSLLLLVSSHPISPKEIPILPHQLVCNSSSKSMFSF